MTSDSRWLDSMPEVYDRNLGPALFASFAKDIATRAAALRPARVLELAAGTGIATSELVACLPDSELVATDLNEAMVAYGAEQVPDADWRQADAQSLDFPDAAFDLVVCQFGVMFFSDKVAAYREAARVLAPGGSYLFNVWDTVDKSRFPRVFLDALAAVLPEDPPDFLTRTPYGYADPDRIRADLDAAGLAVPGIETVRLSGSASSARALAEGFCLGTPIRFALQERGPLPELISAVAEQMTARLGEGQVRGELTALVVTAQHANAR